MKAGFLVPVLTALLLWPVAPALADGGEGGAATGFEGRQAVQFLVGSSFTLQAFQGQLFSYQRFLTDRRAFRLAGGVFLDRRDKQLDIGYDAGATTGELELLGWDNSATLKAQMVFYRGDGPVYFYWGGGPKLTYTDFRSETASHYTADDEVGFSIYALDVDRWGGGLQGFAGVEWFLSDHFSLHAEYAVSGMYTYEKTVDERLDTFSPDTRRRFETSGWTPEFNSDGVRFGLSAYFE